MRKRILNVINSIVDDIYFGGFLDIIDNKYILNTEYDYADWLIHNNFNFDDVDFAKSYGITDYYLGRKDSIDKYISFNSKNELAMYLCDLMINSFSCLKNNLEEDFFDLRKEWEKE